MPILTTLVALLLTTLPIAAAAAPTPLVPLRTLTRFLPSYGSTFGSAVAVSGYRVLIGDPGHLGGDGTTYLFDTAAGHYFRAPETASYDPPLFGRHVGFFGGAPLVGGHGAFLLFDSRPEVPGRIFREPASGDANPPIGFGRALTALDATRILVGYPYGSSAPGRVLVIDAATGAITATLEAPTPAVGDHFGHAIALTATAILVGAPFGDLDGDTDQHSGSEAAAVHVFDRATLAWQRTLRPAAVAPRSFFGHAVATDGTTVVVGAPGEHPSEEREGAAYLFEVATGGLIRRIANPNAPFFDDTFGFSVAALPDRVVIGAPHDDTAAERRGPSRPGGGTTYVFDLDGELLQTFFGGHPHAAFGRSMAAMGGGVAIGAPSAAAGNGYVTLLSPCGDGAVDPAEACDDGNTVDGDGCDSNCSTTACGNGIQTAGEECDFGEANGDVGLVCRRDCTRDTCGDGAAVGNETCDDGNDIDGDGCDNLCVPSLCRGGATIERARLVIDDWGPPFGDERVHVHGRLVFPGGAPPSPFDPAARGAQLRAEIAAMDTPFGPSIVSVVDMEGSRAIPPGLRGGGCTPADGWRVRSRGRLQTYANPSAQLDGPDCGRRGTVDRLHFGLWRDNGRVDFRARAHAQRLESEYAPTSARVVLSLSADATAGAAGDCGVTTLRKCRVDRGSKRLRCHD